MIRKFYPTLEGQTAALAVPDPKNVEFREGIFYVYTEQHYIPPQEFSQDTKDEQDARTHSKLAALTKMSPTEVDSWVRANVTNLAQAQDAISTLAVAVSILARRI